MARGQLLSLIVARQHQKVADPWLKVSLDKKKSHGFKSGERMGQPMSPSNEIKRQGHISFKIPIARQKVWVLPHPVKIKPCPYRGANSILVRMK